MEERKKGKRKAGSNQNGKDRSDFINLVIKYLVAFLLKYAISSPQCGPA